MHQHLKSEGTVERRSKCSGRSFNQNIRGSWPSGRRNQIFNDILFTQIFEIFQVNRRRKASKFGGKQIKEELEQAQMPIMPPTFQAQLVESYGVRFEDDFDVRTHSLRVFRFLNYPAS